MTTFRDLRNWIQHAEVDDVGEHELPGSKWSLHIYSHKRQVNIEYDGLSHMNIIFDEDEVKVYPCTRPGYVDYDKPILLSLDCPITSLPNGAVAETIRDAMGSKASV